MFQFNYSLQLQVPKIPVFFIALCEIDMSCGVGGSSRVGHENIVTRVSQKKRYATNQTVLHENMI
jgi:hypothetical protein